MSEDPKTRPRTILLVDDEPGIRTTLGMLLMDMGYDVLTAENGEKALEIFRREKPPIVLTDIKMPGIGGVELLRIIKREDPETEVVMISGHGDMELAIESLKSEATDFITKPIRDDVLEIALKRANERMETRRQLKAYTENLESMVREKSEKLVAAERLLALGQAVEGLSSAIWGMAGELEGDLRYLNEMPCFVSLHDPSLRIVATNPLMRERLGDRRGAASWEIFAGRAADPERCPVAVTFREGRGQRSRERIRLSEDEAGKAEEIPVIVHTAPIRDAEGRIILVIEIAADITEFNRLNEELAATRRRYRRLFDTVPCYITVQDRDMRIVEANARFREDFPDPAGGFCYKLYKGREEPCEGCPVLETFADGQSHSAEAVVTAASGDRYNVLIWTAPIEDEAGRVIHVMEMSTNITQLHKMRDQLSSLGLLIGSISHGIKGMLTGLDGGMYLVNSGMAKNDCDLVREGWGTVKMMVERIRAMVLDILYYARERELNWEEVDALTFAEEVAATFAPKAQQREIAFEKDFETALGAFEIDRGVVHAALISLLENARDACLADKADKKHQIRFAARCEGDRIIFSVSDNGIGMDRETKDALFTLFFSLKGQKGTGLGLFVSKKIINQHGGTISVESEPGEGTTFTIRVPRSLPEAAKGGTRDKGDEGAL